MIEILSERDVDGKIKDSSVQIIQLPQIIDEDGDKLESQISGLENLGFIKIERNKN